MYKETKINYWRKNHTPTDNYYIDSLNFGAIGLSEFLRFKVRLCLASRQGQQMKKMVEIVRLTKIGLFMHRCQTSKKLGKYGPPRAYTGDTAVCETRPPRPFDLIWPDPKRDLESAQWPSEPNFPHSIQRV